MRGRQLTIALAACALAVCAGPAGADINAAKKWIEKEFQPSALTKDQQLKEMEWFVNAAKPFKGMEINVLSETIPTHEYEFEGAHQGLRGDHGHQGQPSAARRGRGRPGGADPDADQPQPV